MLEYWVWLAHRSSVSDRLKTELLQHFGTPEQVYFASEEDLAQFENLRPEGKEALQDRSLESSREILDTCLRQGIRLLTYGDENYPERLKNIYDPPVLLYYKGELPKFDDLPVVGVVGTRKASAYGRNTAQRFGYEISKSGGVVISGLADGIDSAAMNGALTAGGTIVGVLGCGVDVVYPRSSRSLYRDTERFGCILSEFAPGTEPFRWNFPKRNRIISGLSCGVLVVEAPKKSGSLITARCALDQGRDVFVVPGNVDLPNFEGSNGLLRDGAGAVSSGWEVLEEYQARFPDRIHRDGDAQQDRPGVVAHPEKEPETQPKVAQKPRVPTPKEKQKAPAIEKAIDKAASSPYIDLSDRMQGLSETQKTIVSALMNGPRLTDDIIAETGISAGRLLGDLTILEVKKIVSRLPGKRITLRESKQ